MGDFLDRNIQRVIQESVPGKQITIAHIIASPMSDIYERLGIDEKGAIGILTLSPYETAIIAADIATKSSNVEINGDVQSVETALGAVNDTLRDMLGFTPAPITRT